MCDASIPFDYQRTLLDAIVFGQHSQHFDASGLTIYRRNFFAAAAQALAVNYPTLTHLLGRNAMADLAGDYLGDTGRGVFDWGVWGSVFSAWLAKHPLAKQYAYLVDCARLDWQVHKAYRASDPYLDVESFASLSRREDFRFTLTFAPGTSLVRSRYPIVAIYLAHQSAGAQPDLTTAKALLQAHQGQDALVWRQGLATRVRAVSPEERAWFRLLDDSASTVADLLPTLDSVTQPFDDWLAQAIDEQLVVGLC